MKISWCDVTTARSTSSDFPPSLLTIRLRFLKTLLWLSCSERSHRDELNVPAYWSLTDEPSVRVRFQTRGGTFNALNRTHWAIKGLNSIGALKEAGASVLAPPYTQANRINYLLITNMPNKVCYNR
ncbi:MAG: hypothetical protein LBG81_02500 [Coriobacteriaceae bacterium]|jgi:hypothetical protein|nr:hypothetical protein [Coriobacteriaceae bacterium]